MKSFKQFIKEQHEATKLPILDGVFLVGNIVELYEGRKWIPGRFDGNIGIDQPSHGVGQQHAHVYGRRGDEIVVVNFDGTGSHGTQGKLHADDADALRARGFRIRSTNIVEWTVLERRLIFVAEAR